MSANYYLWIEEKADGPHSEDEIARLLLEARISLKTLFCRDGDQQWRPLELERARFQLSEEEKMRKPTEQRAAPRAQFQGAPPVEEWRRIQCGAEIVMRLAWLCLGLGALGLVFGLVQALGEHPRYELAGGSGGAVSAGILLAVLGQTMYVRAAVEKVAEKK